MKTFLLIATISFAFIFPFQTKAFTNYSYITNGYNVIQQVELDSGDISSLACSDPDTFQFLINGSEGGYWSESKSVVGLQTWNFTIPSENTYVSTFALDCATHDSSQITLHDFGSEPLPFASNFLNPNLVNAGEVIATAVKDNAVAALTSTIVIQTVVLIFVMSLILSFIFVLVRGDKAKIGGRWDHV